MMAAVSVVAMVPIAAVVSVRASLGRSRVTNDCGQRYESCKPTSHDALLH